MRATARQCDLGKSNNLPLSLHSLNGCRTDIGLLEGADRTFGGFLVHNLVPVTLGNFVGGGVFLGLAQWATYDRTGKTGSVATYAPLDDLEVGGESAREFGAIAGSINAGSSAQKQPRESY
jgi:Tat protein secretion system quality control protein TatD with DNase activity